MNKKRNVLKINLLGKKKKKNRHPAGGFYWEPDWPHGTPKKYKKPGPRKEYA
tara:strand:+ start:1107 stop:1262 length:156 start_codon:yes stop_codon:yes gene_type:complete